MKAAPLSKLVFLDETGVKTNMTRRYGRAPRGCRVVDKAPGGYWGSTTVLGAMRADGTTASLVFPGATNAVAFRVYTEEILCPILEPGDTVVLDNLSAHKNTSALAVIEAAGATARFLPPYSPDFNPIEKLWSKLKAHLRRLRPRTEDDLLREIGKLLNEFRSTEASNFCVSCGYSFN